MKRLYRILKILVGLLASAGVVTACTIETPGRPGVMAVSGHLPDLRFRLTGDDGKIVDQTAFRSEPVLLYFGYSGCGNQCPLTLAKLARLGAGQRFRVAFVSVDPLDRPATLQAFLSGFKPLDAHGLTGPPDAVADLARRYRAAYGLPDHGTAVYVFDSKGRARFLLTPQATPSATISAISEAGHA